MIDVVTFGLSLYVVRSDGMGITELEEFDTVSQSWSAGPPSAIGHSAAVELGGLI
ncbi:MAG: hypothetical protein O7H41_00480 [Planctomycetota bacterium]|nr:hypothetical protein [Planctomycetota bacterium]